MLKSHTSADDGVVTSVAMNDEWVVAGLVNHNIHVFSAETGAHVRTLQGHNQGVWCLALVTRGGSERAASRSNAIRVQVKTDGASGGGYQSPHAGLGFAALGMGMGGSFPQEGALPRFGPHLRPTDVCNASTGWGQTSSLVVSGGCDRELKVWDVATG